MPEITVSAAKSRLAALMRYRDSSDPEVIKAKADLAKAVRWQRSEAHIQKLLDQFPPLTAEEKLILTRMLTQPIRSDHESAA